MWTLLQPPYRPLSRANYGFSHDRDRRRTVLFGGLVSKPVSDTWEWDGTSWRDRSFLPAAPLPRLMHAMAYDAARGRVLMFGGNAQFSGGFRNDTWEWDGLNGAWWLLTPVTSPSVRMNHRMTYDRWRSRMVVFGGYYGTALNDTWTFLDLALRAVPPQPVPGATVTLTLDVPRDPVAGYLLACSFARWPGIPVHPDGRVISLTPDPLLILSLIAPPPLFAGFQGSLDGSGRALASMALLPEPALAGVRFFVSGLTYDGMGIRTVMNEVEIVIRTP